MASNLFDIENFGRFLEQFDVITGLVFLLIFTILFAILEKTKVLGEDKRNMNIGLALIIGLLVVIPHITGNFPARADPVLIIENALPQVSLVVVAIIALMILIGVFAHDRLYFGLTAPGWVAFFSIVTIIFIFGSAAGWWAPNFLDFLDEIFGSDALAVVIMIVVFGIIIAFVTGGEERKEIGALKRVGINLGELFGGRK